MGDFIHLRIHSEFSLVDGLVKIKPLVSKLVDMKMPAAAITDQSNMCCLVKYYKNAIGAGIKPIVGVDVWVENPEEEESPFRLTLYARNDKGYLNLTELVSRGFTEGQHHDRAVLQEEWIKAQSEGLLALSGASLGDVGQALLAGKPDLAEQRLARWMEIFPDAFYLELQRTGRVGDEECVHASVELATATGCPVVATNDVHFLAADDFDAHEARVCIHDSKTIDDPRRERRFSEEQYLKSSEEMQELFSDIPEAIENTVEIAKRCNVSLRLGKYFLPNYPIPEGMTMDEFFIKITEEGLEDRLKSLLDPSDPEYQEKRQRYYDRLKFELDIIIQMGFPGYFLIVMDFIQWAKSNGVPVGPGRGSGAGSLVAYAQKITDLDPMAYDLLFERFLNPERVSMPDFDVDFCMDGRDRVISYVADTYGRNAVSQIITFGTMAAKAVVRDVARVQGKPYSLGDRLSKLIPFEVGMTLAKAYEAEEPLREYLANDEEASEVWEMAKKLEGVTRNVGKHAGGVVIAPTKLTDFAPLYCDEFGQSLVTQFDKDDVEQAGLVKFDFLGLRTLTIVNWAVNMINPRLEAEGKPALDINFIPIDDDATFRLLKNGETTAVFQLESRGMKELIKRLQPDCFEDIVALVALFRPGPLQSGMVDDFINRKHGRAELAYPHPDYQLESLKPVLQPTYGIILYQEQVMQIAQVMAGYTLGGADLLRRAMGKKKPEEMAKQKAIFVEGSINQGLEKDLAEKIFDLVEKFAGYGFNKSHSAAYALVSYQTAWLKQHFPAPFMAAVLTADMQNTDKVVTLIEECRRMKLELVLPDVNNSQYTFTVDDDSRIVYGLGAVKGLGEGPVQSVLDARAEGGPFRDLFDFCKRVDLRKVNKRALEALIRSGAMDKLGPGRARMMASINEAVQRAEQHARNENAGMMDLFGEVIPEAEADAYSATTHIKEWPEKERLKLEKDTLGLYLTGHPFDEYEQEVRRFVRTPISELRPGKGLQTVAGLVVAVRTMKSKRGGYIGFVTLDDRSGRIEVTLFSNAYEEAKELLHTDRILVVEGNVEDDEYSGGLSVRAKSVTDISQARLKFAKELILFLNKNDFNNGFVEKLGGVLGDPFDEGCPVVIHYETETARTKLRLSESWKVNPSDDLIQGLRGMLGSERVQLRYNG
ncbi:DNA polymerase III subunit alpha [Hahella sp. CCB-MM4]|uniref:DNA polymerase III subunit alpha n=1 Tax=Hahella sp. (strain CCB-MM4) TaxID=1926491 RepID=UPI000B9C6777|nr:DNA polymerase III subunit alpha [Hahella sp. CCB-MM4]OZG72460.1 DNA polymerase III subunit alpha [Hahella sp. CCB-MM4]